MQVFIERDKQHERIDLGDLFGVDVRKLIELRKVELQCQKDTTRVKHERGERLQEQIRLKEERKEQLMAKKQELESQLFQVKKEREDAIYRRDKEELKKSADLRKKAVNKENPFPCVKCNKRIPGE